MRRSSTREKKGRRALLEPKKQFFKLCGAYIQISLEKCSVTPPAEVFEESAARRGFLCMEYTRTKKRSR